MVGFKNQKLRFRTSFIVFKQKFVLENVYCTLKVSAQSIKLDFKNFTIVFTLSTVFFLGLILE